MPSRSIGRRSVLQALLASVGGGLLAVPQPLAAGFESPNQRPRMAAVGTGSRWFIRATGIDRPYGSAPEMRKYGDYVAVCDVDAQRLGRAAEIVHEWTGKTPDRVSDYRAILDRDDIDIVHISTPDHWHAKLAIEAMLSGKDVYCEKPMTLTVEEGQQMCDVCRRTGRVVQVGTQQRSDPRFLLAIALLRAGRIGQVTKASCRIGGAPTSPELPTVAPPPQLDWNQWLGPAPQAEYCFLAGDYGETNSWSRCHYEFRWWYEYSGGKLTDWGAHHVDIATWGLGKTDTGPISIEPLHVQHPVPFHDGYPTVTNRFNTATEFLFQVKFADDCEIEVRHDLDNGILFEGTEGRIFVNRGRITGSAVEELESNPLPGDALREVYKGQQPVDHFRNFFEAAEGRYEPISDVFSHHRALSTCHLAGIAGRLGRGLKWDPIQQAVLGDPTANGFLAREKRAGFEIDM